MKPVHKLRRFAYDHNGETTVTFRCDSFDEDATPVRALRKAVAAWDALRGEEGT